MLVERRQPQRPDRGKDRKPALRLRQHGRPGLGSGFPDLDWGSSVRRIVHAMNAKPETCCGHAMGLVRMGAAGLGLMHEAQSALEAVMFCRSGNRGTMVHHVHP